MVRFPLRIQLEGHNASIKKRSQFLREYDRVFTGAGEMRHCGSNAIAGAKRTEVWSNWQGYKSAPGCWNRT